MEVVFQPADDRVTYQIVITNDGIHEAEENLAVRLSLPDDDLSQRGIQLGNSEATITVVDDDGMCTFKICKTSSNLSFTYVPLVQIAEMCIVYSKIYRRPNWL